MFQIRRFFGVPVLVLAGAAAAVAGLAGRVVAAGYSFGETPRGISSQVSRVSTVQAVDFNGDGRPDLVVTQASGMKVVWLENRGGGEFRPAGEWQAGLEEKCAGVADFDGDGLLDVLVYSTDSNVPSGQRVALRRGMGPGLLAAEREVLDLPGESGYLLAVRDLNGDGLPEVLGSRWVWLNQRGGKFTALTEGAFRGGVNAAEDAPGLRPGPHAWLRDPVTGLEDFYRSGEVGAVVRFRNLGGGVFAEGEVAVAAVPVDSLGRKDATTGLAALAVPEISARPCLLRTVEREGGLKHLELYRQEEDGTLGLVASMLIPGKDYETAVQSLAAYAAPDGGRVLLALAKKPTLWDVQTAMEVRVTVKGNKVTMAMAPLARETGYFFTGTMADVDGDGASDLVMARTGATGPAGTDALVWLAGLRGKALSQKSQHEIAGADHGDLLKYAGDLNADGSVDFVTQSGSPWTTTNAAGLTAVTLWINRGHGEDFTATRLPVAPADNMGVVAVGDWAHDGWPDVLVWTMNENRARTTQGTNRLILVNRLPNGRVQQKTLLTSTGQKWAAGELVQGAVPGVMDFKASYVNGGTVYPQFFEGKAALKFAAKPSGDLGRSGFYYTDLNWDGKLEKMYGSSWLDAAGGSGGRQVALPAASALFPGLTSTNSLVYRPAGVDFDRDGHEDYFMESYYEQEDTPLLARGDGDASSPTYPMSPGNADATNLAKIPARAVYADLDGDGDLDAVYERQPATYRDPVPLVWQENLGGLVYGAPVTVRDMGRAVGQGNAGAEGRMMVADVDGDGVMDLVTSSAYESRRLRWFKGAR